MLGFDLSKLTFESYTELIKAPAQKMADGSLKEATQEEREKNCVAVKDMQSGEQVSVPIAEAVSYVKDRL